MQEASHAGARETPAFGCSACLESSPETESAVLHCTAACLTHRRAQGLPSVLRPPDRPSSGRPITAKAELCFGRQLAPGSIFPAHPPLTSPQSQLLGSTGCPCEGRGPVWTQRSVTCCFRMALPRVGRIPQGRIGSEGYIHAHDRTGTSSGTPMKRRGLSPWVAGLQEPPKPVLPHRCPPAQSDILSFHPALPSFNQGSL